MKQFRLILFLTVLIISFSHEIIAQADDIIAVKNEIYKWKDSFNKQDLQNTLSIYAENYIGYYPGSAPLDIKAMREQYEKFFGNKFLKVTLNLDVIEVRTGGDLAYTTVNLIWAFLPSVSNAPQYAYEKGIQIWEKQTDGKWQLIRSSIYPYSEKKNTH